MKRYPKVIINVFWYAQTRSSLKRSMSLKRTFLSSIQKKKERKLWLTNDLLI